MILTIASLLCVLLPELRGGDWPMLGRDATRNSVSPEKNPPLDWDVGEFDRVEDKWVGARNVKWTAQLGSQTNGTPVVADGLVWIGTNNRQPPFEEKDIAGVLMCFRESDGELLYEYVSPRLPNRVNDNGWGGISCSPLIEGDRMWFTTNRCETVCLDIGPLKNGEGKPKVLWECDMMKEWGVFPRATVMGPARTCSIGSHNNFIYVITTNGVDEGNESVPAPEAPSLICFNKNTGEVAWTDNSPGKNILRTQVASPLVVEIGGRGQVIAPQGDGWLRSFDALTGKLIWKFDINPKTSIWQFVSRGLRNEILATPVFYDNRVYIACGQGMEHGDGLGRLCCIDPSKTGDISSELAVDVEDKPLPHRRLQAVDTMKGEKAIANPNSGLIWEYIERDEDRDGKIRFEERFYRTMSNVAIKNDLVIATDFSGLIHCLDAKTGKRHWVYDGFAQMHASPLIVDDKVYVTDEDGDVAIFNLSAKEHDPLAEISMDSSIDATPIFANGTLYVANRNTLFAIQTEDEEATESGKKPGLSHKPGYWPQWRGPNRDNVSTETGLLKEWPEDGPPLLWRVKGIGQGIASVAIDGGRIFTMSDYEDHEYVVALDEQSGEHLWTVRLGKSIPQSPLMRLLSQRCPTVDGERLYAFTALGELVCLRCRDGGELWRKNYVTDFGGKKGIWGYCDYPLVDGDKLICAPGGSEAAIVALNKVTGEAIWKTEIPDGDVAGYAATLVTMVDQIRQYVVYLQSGLIGVSADDGTILWRNNRFATRQNSLTPLVKGNEIFCANERYVEGAALLELSANEDKIQVRERYHVSRRNLNNFQDTLLRIGDHVYSDSRYGPTCIQWKTGELSWELARRGRWMNAMLYADGHLYVRQAEGVMKLVEANPKEYVEKNSFAIPEHQPSTGATHPVIAGGRLYLRDNDNLFCYDVQRDALEKPRPEPRTVTLQPDQVKRGDKDQRERGGPRSVFVPTPQDVVEKMLELTEVKKTDVVYDLGSGDGRIVVTAAKKYGSRAVGYEIDKDLVDLSRENAAKAKVENLVTIHHKDLFTADLAEADVVAVFLLPVQLEKLLPQLEMLKPGSRIVSHQFAIPDVQVQKVVEFESKEDNAKHKIYVWTTPLRKETK
jgi:outer membrane protein assembly factor BamB/tRNA A58 N-methylase Trm61